MQKFTGYRCSVCGAEYLPGQVTYTCPSDGGNLDVVLDYPYLKKKFEPDVTENWGPEAMELERAGGQANRANKPISTNSTSPAPRCAIHALKPLDALR